MAVRMGLVTCFTVLVACLLHPVLSEHKKKIIVKVPHVIKHIHHDVYKPIHIHKVHAKKVEHHHHEEIEEKIPKWKPKRGHGEHHKAHGSYSHLQPVLLHHESQEHIEHPVEHQQRLGRGLGQGRGREHDYHGHDESREGYWSSENDSGERRTRPLDDNPRDKRPRFEPIKIGDWFGRSKDNSDSDEWLISSEDLRELKEDYGFLGGKGRISNGRKRNKDNFVSILKKPAVIDMEKDGWKPLMDFSGWKDVDELHQNGHRGFRRDPINYSGEEDDYEGSKEERVREKRIQEVQNERQKPRKNQKKKGKWSKQIEVHEPSSEEYEQPQWPNHSYNYPASSQTHQSQRSSEQSHTQLHHREPYRTPDPQRNWQEHLPTPQPQQWPHPQHLPSLTPASRESQPSSVVWSGHHLQTPQHTMWHVQQHNVQHPVSSGLPIASLSPLPTLRKVQPQQSPQASVSAPRVAASPWPSPQKTPGVTQWEQTVHMGNGAGPGSSYKVEVVNYNGQ